MENKSYLFLFILLSTSFGGLGGINAKIIPKKTVVASIPLVTFDGAESTTFEFRALNDPVMVRSKTVVHLF